MKLQKRTILVVDPEDFPSRMTVEKRKNTY